jgi:hypothetical protein
MKTLRLLALLVAAAMFLVACGTNGNGNGNGDDDPVVTTGTLFVNVNVPATVTVLDSDGVQVDRVSNTQAENWDVEAGDFTVQAEAAGYGAQSEPVTITAGQSSTVNFSLVPDTVVLGNVANVEVTRFFDAAGNDYDTNDEINPVKDAILVAAQTEELVGIEIKVTDEDGQAIQGAPVTLSVTGRNLIVAVYSGKPTDIQSSAATFDGVVTDAQGMAYFTLEATYALDSLNILEDGLNINEEPAVKVLVSSVGGDNVVKRTEFKAYFVNMSHLWYWGSPYRNQDHDPINLEYAEERLGGVVGPFTNIWTIGETNRHEFNTVALVKQPTSGPFDVGSDEDIFDGRFPGYVRYEIIDVSEDADGDPLIVWENWEDDCNWMDRPAADLDPLVCESGEGSVALVPVDGLGLEDLPISATVKATYVFVSEYGEQVATGTPNQYEFELKDYTFTKTWVGGYLEVDKFVDQHVLTWRGELVTLEPTSVNYDDVYTSKVHVVVNNPSQSTMFNISVRDVVPAELGVVTSSISDGGTYDPVNHAVTWNNVPALDALAPGDDPIVLTFDVYARHKPGYCWTPDAAFGDIPPLLPPPVGTDGCDPYDDPYDVTNGQQYQDFSGNTLLGVTAAAQFVDDETQPQVVFYYEPQADESTIWVVRPLFAIEKELVSPDVMDVGAAAIFDITVRQIDRVSRVVDEDSTEYAFLFDRYPWEFTGTLLEDEDFHAVDRDQDGSFGVPSGVTIGVDGSDVRDNPYARGIAVTDAFDYGLDFTSGLDFDGSQIVPTSTKVVGKTVTFGTIADLPRGEQAKKATIRLTGQLPSDDLANAPDGSSQNSAIAQLGEDGLFAWQNCAYLAAPQLNQPHPDSPEFGDTIYALWPGSYPAFGTSNLWIPWHQIDGVDQLGTRLVPNDTDAPAVPNGSLVPWSVVTADGRIESCDEVAVVPQPPLPFLGINVDGEHDIVTLEADGTLTLDGRRDVFAVGEQFFYVYSVENSGGGAALNVLVEIERTNTRTAFTGAPVLYTTTAPRTLASVFTQQADGGYYDLTVNTAGEKHLVIPVMDPFEVAVIVIPASANLVGGQTVTHQVPSYDNPPVYQDFDFLISTDSTSVAP